MAQPRNIPWIMCLCAFLLASAMVALPARGGDQWTLVDAQFHSSQFQLVSLGGDGIHAYPAGAAAPFVFPWDNVLEISRPVAGQAAKGKFELYLTTGDRLLGEPVAMADEKLQWNSPALGQIELPLSQVIAIAQSGKPLPTLDEIRRDDVIQLANGDVTHGIITQVTGSSATLQAGDATPTLAWDAISAILFATPPGDAGPAKPTFRVCMADDTSITVESVSLAGEQLTLHLDAKTSRDLNLGSVAAIEQINGPVTWLTSLKPAENVYKPFFNENFPTRFDKTVDDGTPISRKFPGFRHGIGCHSYSRLVYNLPGHYAGFRTQYVVDSDSSLADVTVRIKLDDKTVFEEKNVKGGSIYPVQDIPLGDAKKLTLEVDYGENYASEDRFVWLDPALTRVAPPAAAKQP